MNTKLFWLLTLLLACGSLLAGCDCGDDDDDNDDQNDDDTGDDDDNGDDDTSDDDTSDDDTSDDDTSDDDTGDDDTGDDDTTEVCDWDTYKPLIEAGRDALGDFDPDTAYDQFADALDVCPDWPDAKMGMLLADTQWYTKQLYQWVMKLSNFNPAPHEVEAKSIGTVVQRTIRLAMLPVNAEMFALVEDLETNHPDVRFYFPSLPMVIVDEHVVLDFAGEWDIADVRNVRAAAGLLEFLERFLLSFNFDFNYSTYAFWPAPGGSIEEIIHSYSGLVLALLDDEEYPDFLKFLEGGEAELVISGLNLGHGCIDFVDAFRLMREETDEQVDDVAGYVDENDNNRWDEGEMYFTPYFGTMYGEMTIFFEDFLKLMDDLGAAALDGSADDLQPMVPNWFNLADLNFLIEMLELLDVPFFAPVPVPVGTWFYEPLDDGLRTPVGLIANLLYELTMPEGGRQ